MTLHSTLFKVINYILIIVIAAAVFFLANNFIRNQAIEGCAQSYRYSETLASGSTVTYPMTTEYNECLKTKGIK